MNADPTVVTAVKPRGRAWSLKYGVEWVLALLGLAMLLPLLLLLGLLVRLSSPGPALYVAERLGRGGRVFRLYKFRSMRVSAPEITAPDGKVVTLTRDPRLTRVGTFLRLGFDELPQLLNVVKGDMCLIGPRPDVPRERERYTPRERRRLQVLPGITGLTQVVGGRELNNASNYELDVRYVEQSCCCTDLAILLLTLPYSLGAKRIGRGCFRRYLQGIEDPAG
jgi:lipopolysaccharide/colanic/teichoic acid biosynthesis glycosyltransferase